MTRQHNAEASEPMSVLAPKEGMLRRYDNRGRAKATRYIRRTFEQGGPWARGGFDCR